MDTVHSITLSGQRPHRIVETRTPQHGRFFLVRMSAVNAAGADISVPTFTIQDDSGTTYTELSEGTGSI